MQKPSCKAKTLDAEEAEEEWRKRRRKGEEVVTVIQSEDTRCRGEMSDKCNALLSVSLALSLALPDEARSLLRACACRARERAAALRVHLVHCVCTE